MNQKDNFQIVKGVSELILSLKQWKYKQNN